MTAVPAETLTSVPLCIVGTGFAGLGLAIRLKQEGIHDFILLERADEVGGTWRDNSYPGAACDVPSLLYSFSFAPNPRWSHSFSPQAEIQRYLRDCVDRFDLRPHIRFGHDLLDAAWDDGQRRWTLTTNRGVIHAAVMISAAGPMSEPALPAIPGVETFAGPTFHSARWDHDHDLAGERVAVIGTGASAIQFVPQIQPQVARLDLYQRTAPWVIPRFDRELTDREHRRYERFPIAQQVTRAGIYWSRETFAFAFTHPRVMGAVARASRRHLETQVSDRALRTKLTPHFVPGCKRILISNDYYPALTQPNVDLVTDGIAEIRPHSIVSRDGTERQVDTLIFGTGFHVTDMPIGRRIRGRSGLSLAETWTDGMSAYLGTTVHGFPNLFLLIGPNTGLGHTSMVFMMESQFNYVLGAIKHMRRLQLATVDVRAGVQEDYQRFVQKRTEGTVWTTGGCSSYYLDANGRNTSIWPGSTWTFRRLTRRFDSTRYHVRSDWGTPAPTPATAEREEPVAV